MNEPFIFWKQSLRVAGPGSHANAVTRLRALLATGRFGMRDRLAGKLEGSRVRVWKTGPLGQAGDVVEFEGVVRPSNEGTVIEGALQYKRATKIQFLGLLLMGLALLGVGAFQKLAGAQPDSDLLGMGAFVTLLTLFWIYSSSRMKHEQIGFIESKLSEVVAV